MGSKTPEEALKGWEPKGIKKYKVSVYRLADGTYEAFPAKGKLPAGAERLDKQPKLPTSGDPHEGTRVALKKLEGEYPRQIAWGRHVAVLLAKKKLTVHSREVRDEMERRGLVGSDTGREFWLGAVFKGLKTDKILADTGQTYKYSDAERGIHERKVTIWVLVEGADTSAYDQPPREE